MALHLPQAISVGGRRTISWPSGQSITYWMKVAVEHAAVDRPGDQVGLVGPQVDVGRPQGERGACPGSRRRLPDPNEPALVSKTIAAMR
jgi:hypothetical protein